MKLASKPTTADDKPLPVPYDRLARVVNSKPVPLLPPLLEEFAPLLFCFATYCLSATWVLASSREKAVAFKARAQEHVLLVGCLC
jgi:hypothetical protein